MMQNSSLFIEEKEEENTNKRDRLSYGEVGLLSA